LIELSGFRALIVAFGHVTSDFHQAAHFVHAVVDHRRPHEIQRERGDNDQTDHPADDQSCQLGRDSKTI